jgi:hypothetical protein
MDSIKFSPRAGYPQDWEYLMLSQYPTASGASIEMGTVVVINASGVVSAATTSYGYFLMQDVTSDGPSELERITGQYQMWEAKAKLPVSLLPPMEGSQVYTKHVSSGNTSLIVGAYLDLSDGLYVTNSANTGNAGIVRALPAGTGITGIYVVEVMNT